MKGIIKRIVCAASACLLLAGCAHADGLNHWVYSQLHGATVLAAYTGEYDGYVCVDGYGGVTAGDSYYVTVISKNASVWQEPRTNSKKLGSAPHGESLSCRSDDGGESIVYENGFYGVEYKGMEGWINEDYVVNNELVITLLESNVPAYIAPDEQSKKVGSLSKLTEYRVIGLYDDFYIVNLRDAAAAYIPMSVKHRDNTFSRLYHAGGSMDLRVTTPWKVTLRTGPGSDYPEMRTVREGEQLRVMDVIDGWVMIDDDETNQFAFIACDELTLP